MASNEELGRAFEDIGNLLTDLKRNLEAVDPHSTKLPPAARTALDDALRAAESAPRRLMALRTLLESR